MVANIQGRIVMSQCGHYTRDHREMAMRRSREDYFELALLILDESGFPGLSASALCDRMAVTRGSFYHHFDSFEAFVGGLLSYWERHYSRDLITGAAAVDEISAMVKRQVQQAVSLPHGAEVALRAWATINPQVAAAQRRVDRLRHDGLTRSLVDHGVARAIAEVCADITLNALIGAQMSGASGEEMNTMYEELGALCRYMPEVAATRRLAQQTNPARRSRSRREPSANRIE
jgi:AcrR family transcriptional regulator